MKTSILAGALSVLLCSSAIAQQDVTIQGDSPTLGPLCAFQDVQTGTMTYDESTNQWTTTTAGGVSIRTRDVSRVDVTNTGKKLYRVDGVHVDNISTVDYGPSTGSMIVDMVPSSTVQFTKTENAIAVTGVDDHGTITLNIRHTLTPSGDYVAQSQTGYYTLNTVTCTF